MKIRTKSFRGSRTIGAILLVGLTSVLPAATYTVTSSADSGTGSLREAITLANGAAGADVIEFDAAVTSIILDSLLPGITGELTLDGTVNRAAGEYVEINGNSLAGAGLAVAAANSTIRGLRIHSLSGSGGHGISVQASGVTIRGNVIHSNGGNGISSNSAGSSLGVYGNIIGLLADGSTAAGNANHGILIASGATGVQIGGIVAADRNVVSSNGNYGINIIGSPVQVRGNYVGTDSTGLIARGNTSRGVSTSGANSVIRGNVLSGNGVDDLYTSAGNIQVHGNIIGLGADGDTILTNSSRSVYISGSPGLVVGSSDPADRNVIAGNCSTLLSVNSTGAVIEGNYVGTDITGLLDRTSGNAGIVVDSTNTTLRGNVIGGLAQDGIRLRANGTHVHGNYIGIGSDGDTIIGNEQDGIEIQLIGTDARIGTGSAADRNVIAGNGQTEIRVVGPGAIIEGNYLGTDSTGLLDRSSTSVAIISSTNTGTGMIVSGNVIAGSAAAGVQAIGSHSSYYGNFIGLGADGETPIPNATHGILLQAGASNAIIGSSGPGDQNVISSNGECGIQSAAPTTNISGNIIGLDQTGTLARGNGSSGVELISTAIGSWVGTEAEGGNLISANGVVSNSAVNIYADNVTVERNKIGTDITETVIFPVKDDGLYITGANVIVGGPDPANGNLIVGAEFAGIESISNNALIQNNTIRDGDGSGILIDGINVSVTGNTVFNMGAHGVVLYDSLTAQGVSILENSLHSLGGIAIGLGWFGPISNDALDADSGPNGYQNTPVLGPLQVGGTELNGILQSAANQTYRIDIYQNDSVPLIGYGDAKDHLGFFNVTTDGSGDAALSYTLPTAAALGEVFAATATDVVTSSTSMISRSRPVEVNPFASTTITRSIGAPNPTSGPTVDFDVAFSEPVKGISTANFGVTEINGISGSSVASVTNPFGNALSLSDGDAFTVPTGGLNLTGQSFTIEFWASRSSMVGGDNSFPVSFHAASSVGESLHLGWGSDYAFRFSFFDEDLNSVLEFGLVNHWDHWAVTYDHGTAQRSIYWNGNLIASDVATVPFSGPGILTIGTNPYSDFHGVIDELRIWNSARSQVDIQAAFLTPADGTELGLVALYQFESLQDLGVNGDGADDLADAVGGRHLDRANGTGTITTGDIPVLTASVTATLGTGTGDLGLELVSAASARDSDDFPIATPETSTETYQIVTQILDWLNLAE